ncbi:hypothetical protein D3C87_1630190 [compost metagenome]
MNGAGTAEARRQQDGILVQVAFGRARRADADRLIRAFHIGGVPIRFRADHDGLQAHFAAGANYAQGNFTAIGNKNLVETLV